MNEMFSTEHFQRDVANSGRKTANYAFNNIEREYRTGKKET